MISCGGTTALPGTTTCSNSLSYSTVLQTFSLDLQWNSASDVTSPTLSATNPSDPASASGAAYNTTWDSVGLPVILGISGSMLELTDNYVDVQRGVELEAGEHVSRHAPTVRGNLRRPAGHGCF